MNRISVRLLCCLKTSPCESQIGSVSGAFFLLAFHIEYFCQIKTSKVFKAAKMKANLEKGSRAITGIMILTKGTNMNCGTSFRSLRPWLATPSSGLNAFSAV